MTDCAICTTASTKLIRCWDCGGTFCKACFLESLNYSNKCPHCSSTFSNHFLETNLSINQRKIHDKKIFDLELTKQLCLRVKEESAVHTCSTCCNKLSEKFHCTKCCITYCKICFKHSHTGMCSVPNIRFCPGCNVPITKEPSGCDQMYCILCHTAFSWVSGKKCGKTDVIHNPHYIDLHRQYDETSNCYQRFAKACASMGVNNKAYLGQHVLYIESKLDKSLSGLSLFKQQTHLKIEQKRRSGSSKFEKEFATLWDTLRRNEKFEETLIYAKNSLYATLFYCEDAVLDVHLDRLFAVVNHSLLQTQTYHGKSNRYYISRSKVFLPYC